MRRWYAGRPRVKSRRDSARHGREPKVVGEIKIEEVEGELPTFRPKKVAKMRGVVSRGYVETSVVIEKVVNQVAEDINQHPD